MAKSPEVSRASAAPESNYRIGAVARLTGITADTLRVWERRYAVVTPQRSAKGGRRYSRDDVLRLALIKRLVDAGHAIGSVANLEGPELQQRLDSDLVDATLPLKADELNRPYRVAVLGEALPTRLLNAGTELPGVEIVAATSDPDTFLREAPARCPDVIVLEYPSVTGRTAGEVNQLLRLTEARRAVVVYAFAREETAHRLQSRQIVALRAPVGLTDLQPWCSSSTGRLWPDETTDSSALGQAPYRRYTAAQLSRIATISTTVKCECPRHLADLVFSLRNFESYSAECENTNAADALLHAQLHNATGHARAILEESLHQVLTAEGVSMETPMSRGGIGRGNSP
jgi:DNA-binding transcriptional MerR regulator